jgi:hypothetical protein
MNNNNDYGNNDDLLPYLIIVFHLLCYSSLSDLEITYTDSEQMVTITAVLDCAHHPKF